MWPTIGRFGSVVVLVASAMIIVAFAPDILTDPIRTAVDQTRNRLRTLDKLEATAIGGVKPLDGGQIQRTE